MGEDFEAKAKEPACITVVAADVIRNGLIVHFSDETSSLFSPCFLYDARTRPENTPLFEQGVPVPGSPIADALDYEG